MDDDDICRSYFIALRDADWTRLGALVDEHVSYRLSGGSALPSDIRGRAAFLTMTREVFRQFQDARFHNVQVRPMVLGLRMYVADYDGEWRARDGQRRSEHGRVAFELTGDKIARVAVNFTDDQLASIAREWNAAPTTGAAAAAR